MSYAAESYESYMVPALFDPWSSELIRGTKLRPSERVLDLACGTGIVARRLAAGLPSQNQIVGLDLNPEMTGTARIRARQEGLEIEWCAGRAGEIPFADTSIDLIVCQFGLMFFADRLAALREMHRVLVASGRLVVSVWQSLDRHPFYQTLHDMSKEQLGKSSVEDVFSLGDSAELHTLLADCGFEDIEIESVSKTAHFVNPQEFLAWEVDVNPAECPALMGLDVAAQEAILASVRNDMQTALRKVMRDGQAVLPFHAHIARCRRAAN